MWLEIFREESRSCFETGRRVDMSAVLDASERFVFEDTCRLFPKSIDREYSNDYRFAGGERLDSETRKRN